MEKFSVSPSNQPAWRFFCFHAREGTSPAFTVGIKLGRYRRRGEGGRQRWVVLDAIRGQWRPKKVEETMLDTAQADGAQVRIRGPQDPGQAGKSQAQNFVRALPTHSVVAQTATGDKMARAHPWAAKAGSGLVLLVRGDWNEEFLVECTGFPTGAHDDMIDAASAAFERILGGTTAIMDYYRRQLVERGVDPDALPRAGSDPVAEQRATDDIAARAAQDEKMRALARAMAGGSGR